MLFDYYTHQIMTINFSVFDFVDYSKGFGGKYGVQTDRVDKSALGYEHHEQVDKHESQKGNYLCVSH